MIWWNKEGFKFGICDQKPLNSNYSLLCLSNNTAIEQVFSKLLDRFKKLYQKKFYLHHYMQYIGEDTFDEAS